MRTGGNAVTRYGAGGRSELTLEDYAATQRRARKRHAANRRARKARRANR